MHLRPPPPRLHHLAGGNALPRSPDAAIPLGCSPQGACPASSQTVRKQTAERSSTYLAVAEWGVRVCWALQGRPGLWRAHRAHWL